MREIYFEELMEQIPLLKQIHLWNSDWEPITTWLNDLAKPEEEYRAVGVMEHIKNITGAGFGWSFMQVDSREAHELLVQFKNAVLRTENGLLTHRSRVQVENDPYNALYKVYLQDENLQLDGKHIPGEVLTKECYPERYYMPATIRKYTGEALRFSVLEERYKKGMEVFSSDVSTETGILADYFAWDKDGERIEISSIKDLRKLYRAHYVEVKSLKAIRLLQVAGYDNYMNSPFKIPSPHMPRRYYMRDSDMFLWGDWIEEVELEYLRAREAFI